MSLLLIVAIAAAGGLAVLWLKFGYSEVRNWLRVLWVCRVSAASVLAGIVLADVVQAQDVFAETSRSTARAVEYWTGFLGLLFLSWAFPVHFAARRVLDLEDWAIDPFMMDDAAREQQRELFRGRYRR